MEKRKSNIQNLLRVFQNPTNKELERLNAARARVPEKYRGDRQLYGEITTGCGATIGAMPRCDFNCTGCYLGKEANLIPPRSLSEIKNQIRHLRSILGPNGNIQITDGEVTLLPEDELIELIQFSLKQDLIPMVMTHGDSYRRRPHLLKKLVLEGGLTETSIHVDTTQKGRTGSYRHAKTEEDLNPLRDEFAEMIREVRKQTNKPLTAAMTATINEHNHSQVGSIMKWYVKNNDVIKLMSFQPMAQVGRTREGLGGHVSVENLWRNVSLALHSEKNQNLIARGRMNFGHPDCSRFIPGVTIKQKGKDPFFHPIFLQGDSFDEKIIPEFLKLFRAVSFREDSFTTGAARFLGMLKKPKIFKFFSKNLVLIIWHWAKRANPDSPTKFLFNFVTGRAKIHKAMIASHHFMSEAECKSEEGKERLDMCVFHVSVDGNKTPMCEVNATPVREEFYAKTDLVTSHKEGT